MTCRSGSGRTPTPGRGRRLRPTAEPCPLERWGAARCLEGAWLQNTTMPPAPASRAARSRGARPALPLVDRDVIARALARVDLARPRDLLLLVLDHLQPLGDPAARSRDREQHGEHADRHLQRLVDEPGVEVDVRVELAVDEVVVLERDLLELQRDVPQRVG